MGGRAIPALAARLESGSASLGEESERTPAEKLLADARLSSDYSAHSILAKLTTEGDLLSEG